MKSTRDRVVMLSWWRMDERRNLRERVRHLLDKDAARWVWVVGDSDDGTESILKDLIAASGKDVTLVHYDTGIPGDDTASRLSRLSATACAALDCVNEADDYVLIHESDLLSPRDIAAQFLASEKLVIAGWVTLQVGGHRVFYDTWGYHQGGRHFTNSAPYHPVYSKDQLFEVDSVGSCWMFPAWTVRDGLRCYTRGAQELCAGTKGMGFSIWVNPLVPIEQPADLWIAYQHG